MLNVLRLRRIKICDAMSHYPHPKGWTYSYSSRVLSEDLELNSEGVVNVLAIRSKISSVWEKARDTIINTVALDADCLKVNPIQKYAL
jgi:hypothetical protein